jgi:hypothetical protein
MQKTVIEQPKDEQNSSSSLPFNNVKNSPNFLFNNCFFSCFANMSHAFKVDNALNPHHHSESHSVYNQVSYLSDDEIHGEEHEHDDNNSDDEDDEDDEDYKIYLKKQQERPSYEVEAYNLMFERDEKDVSHKVVTTSDEAPATISVLTVSQQSQVKLQSPFEASSKSGSIKSILTEDEMNQWSVYKNDHFHSIDDQKDGDANDLAEEIQNLRVSEPEVNDSAEQQQEPEQQLPAETQPVTVETETNVITEEKQTAPILVSPSEYQPGEDFDDDEDPFAHIDNETLSDNEEDS